MAVRYRTILLENGQRATFLDSAEALADVELLRGNPEIAARILEEAQEEREALGDYGAMLLPFLARALYVIGRYDKAESAAEGAARSGHPLWSYLGRGTLARVRARQGQEDAESLAAQAVAGFERTDYLNFTGAVLMDLGEVLALSGRTDQATQAFERARRLFDQKASLVLASQARSAQEALTRE